MCLGNFQQFKVRYSFHRFPSNGCFGKILILQTSLVVKSLVQELENTKLGKCSRIYGVRKHIK